MTTNRLTPYEAGWLTLLVRHGICTEDEARAAMNRVAQAAIDRIEERRRQKRAAQKRRDRKKRGDE